MLRESLVLRVLALSFLFLALPLLVASFILFQKSYEEAIARAEENLERSATFRTEALRQIKPFSDAFLQELDLLLKLESSNLKSEALAQELKEISSIEGYSVNISILGEQEKGQYPILNSSDSSLIGTKAPFLINEAELAQGKDVEFIQYIYSAEENSYIPYIFSIVPILPAGEKTAIGYLMVSANIQDEIFSVMQKGKFLYPHVSFALVQHDTIVFAATDPAIVGQYFAPLSEDKKHTTQFGKMNIASQPLHVTRDVTRPFFEFTFKNTVNLAYPSPLSDLGVGFLTYSPKQLIFQSTIRSFLIIYLIYGVIIIAGGAVAYLLTTWMARPLKQLMALMEKVRTGHLQERFVTQPLGFEINTLGLIFNQTLEALLGHMQKAEDYRVKKELHRKEVDLGRQVQRQLFPRDLPEIENIEVATLYRGAQIAGGDFHDVILKNNQLFFMVADMATQGISSCLYSLGVRSLLRSYITLGDDIGTILTQTNNMFCKDAADSGMYITVFLCKLDLHSKILTYYSCGHMPAMVRKKNGEIVLLTQRGMAMGLREGIEYQSGNVQLEEGDLLLLYTNGVTAAMNERHQLFSVMRLENLLLHRKWITASEVTEGVEKEVLEYVGGAKLEGEITLLSLRVL